MAHMSIYSDYDNQRYRFIVCIVECETKDGKEYEVIVSPFDHYSVDSLEKLLSSLKLFLTFSRVNQKRIRYFLKKENNVFEIEITHDDLYVKIDKYVETFFGLREGLLKVYNILKDAPSIEIYKFKDIVKSE